MNRPRQSRNVSEVLSAMRLEEKIEKASKSPIPLNERLHGRQLNMAGRKAYFEEYFTGIKLENQEIMPIGPFTDPRTTNSFKIGYQSGKLLIKRGIIPEEYQNIANNNKTR